jgi:5'-deoxynucleotidase YfbR-like HD superfamily hydrolase
MHDALAEPKEISMITRFVAGSLSSRRFSAPAFAGCDQAQAVDKMTKVATALGQKAGEAKTAEDSQKVRRRQREGEPGRRGPGQRRLRQGLLDLRRSREETDRVSGGIHPSVKHGTDAR